ncbi:D-glycero-beta-D-manno-heptose 1-phosphate adenylyltransferase [Desulfobulbus oligotrophicus]|jgi:rfaE bifunctional protein nucleotidyltransferase chain/domain|nr:D-glycero-beta-D-manno-heptose 1-phosphate adenylyltransferase [Desulfobulbus oligotrophicus]MDY0391186.1 D-glycero-beta-D-manno-heptose 1-phosphate adenylyltransferase [Desulfobulbus oligotrophicus]
MSGPSLFPAVACVQFPIAPGRIEENIRQVESLIAEHAPGPDTLLLLPEMWATGFDYAQTAAFGKRTPEILKVMARLAETHHIYLAGSLTELTEDDALPRNTLFLVGPEGVVGKIPKQHLFGYWQEDQYYQRGMSTPPLQTPLGPLAGLVCYDLRFPETARHQVFAGARLLAVCAQWPRSRLEHWQTLVRARAIENQVYVAAVNSCGRTGHMDMAGHSMIVAPDGTVLQSAAMEAAVITSKLDSTAVDEQRHRFYPAGDRSWLTTDHEKVQDLDTVAAKTRLIRRQGSRLAFTNGCFDLVHAGHVSYLEAARRTADCLVVGINTDASVRSLKGADRPVNNEQDRARVLAALGCVDYVILFADPTPLRLITTLLPDVLVKGADWPEAEIVGASEVKAAGGRVVRIVFQHDRSTTALIDKIRASARAPINTF